MSRIEIAEQLREKYLNGENTKQDDRMAYQLIAEYISYERRIKNAIKS